MINRPRVIGIMRHKHVCTHPLCASTAMRKPPLRMGRARPKGYVQSRTKTKQNHCKTIQCTVAVMNYKNQNIENQVEMEK